MTSVNEPLNESFRGSFEKVSVKSVNDINITSVNSRYTFTGDGFFFGGAWANNYDVDSDGRAINLGYCYTNAVICDANGNTMHVINESSGTGNNGIAKIFVPVKRGWYAVIASASYTNGVYLQGTAIYTY